MRTPRPDSTTAAKVMDALIAQAREHGAALVLVTHSETAAARAYALTPNAGLALVGQYLLRLGVSSRVDRNKKLTQHAITHKRIRGCAHLGV